MTIAHAWNPGGFDAAEPAVRTRLDTVISALRDLAPGFAHISATADEDGVAIHIEASAATGAAGMARIASELGLSPPTVRSGSRETWLQSYSVSGNVTISLTGDWRPLVGTVEP